MICPGYCPPDLQDEACSWSKTGRTLSLRRASFKGEIKQAGSAYLQQQNYLEIIWNFKSKSMNIVMVGKALIWRNLLTPILCFSPVLILSYIGITCILKKGRAITFSEFKCFLGFNPVLPSQCEWSFSLAKKSFPDLPTLHHTILWKSHIVPLSPFHGPVQAAISLYLAYCSNLISAVTTTSNPLKPFSTQQQTVLRISHVTLLKIPQWLPTSLE